MTKPQKWTPERDAKLAEMYRAGVPYKEMAEALGYREDQWNLLARRRRALRIERPANVSRTVKARAGALGGKTPSKWQTPWSEQEIDDLRKIAKTATSLTEIAKAFPGRTYAAVTSKMRLLHIPKPSKPSTELASSSPRPDVPPAFKPPGMPIRLPYRSTATPKPDLVEWQKRREAMERRLEADGGNLSVERKSA